MRRGWNISATLRFYLGRLAPSLIPQSKEFIMSQDNKNQQNQQGGQQNRPGQGGQGGQHQQGTPKPGQGGQHQQGGSGQHNPQR